MTSTEQALTPNLLLAAEVPSSTPSRAEWPKPDDAGFTPPPEHPETNERILQGLTPLRQLITEVEALPGYQAIIGKGKGEIDPVSGLENYGFSLMEGHEVFFGLDPESRKLCEIYLSEGTAKKDRTLNNKIIRVTLKKDSGSPIYSDQPSIEVGCNMVYAQHVSGTREIAPQVSAAIWGIEIREQESELYLAQENRKGNPNLEVSLVAGTEDPKAGWESVLPVGRAHRYKAKHIYRNMIRMAQEATFAGDIGLNSEGTVQSNKRTVLTVADNNGVTTVRWGLDKKKQSELVLNAALDLPYEEILSMLALDLALLKNGLGQKQ